MRHALAAATLFLAVTPAAAQEMRAEASEVQAHVEFLADDLLEGRGSGQRGYDLAALYVASRYRALGLEPAGDNGTYLQDILYRRSSLTGSEVLLNGNRNGDIKVTPNVDDERLSIDAELVFVGYGLEAGAYG
ncbi:MAG: peptidase M28, partial [Erythrobacter sp.]|nr:peptidase M28 [Erythrobacter sp.]